MESLKVIMAFVLGFVIAQILKIVITLIIKKGKVSFSEIKEAVTKSGGMPSAHTASFTAVTVTIGYLCGFDSALFALALCNTGIIVYDAVNVRYAVGVHGKILHKMISDSKAQVAEPLKLVEGHTVFQAIVGIVLGILIAIVMNMCL